MNSRDIVVRIVQSHEQPCLPAGKAQLPKREALSPGKEKKLIQYTLNGLGLAAIAVLLVFFGVSFFHLGLSLNDCLIIVGIPMALGVITSYAIF